MTYVRRHIFWSEPGKIRRANLDGSGVTTFVSDDQLTVGGLALRRKFEDDRLACDDCAWKYMHMQQFGTPF